MCPHTSEEARRLWSKACNFHRKTDCMHQCGNPAACERTLSEAEVVEQSWISFQWEMA
jgi:hypothetical protein